MVGALDDEPAVHRDWMNEWLALAEPFLELGRADLQFPLGYLLSCLILL